MKRQRPSDDAVPAGAGVCGRDFSFGFAMAADGGGGDGAPSAASAPAAPAPERRLAPAGVAATFLAGHATRDYVNPVSQFAMSAGDALDVDWEGSTPFRLRVRRRGSSSDTWGDVPPSAVTPALTQRDTADGTYVGGAHASDCDTVAVLDAAWAPATALTGQPHFSATPLALEPGLDSLVWPLTGREFLRRFYRRKALVVHAAGARFAPSLRPDLADYAVKALVNQSSRVVVWMRDTSTGRMQYLDSSPEVALACYAAGHSLYFNPPMEMQRKWLLPLCEDLGMGAFGATADGGIGGDVEVFAVKGRHSTPWHWDAQENFTLQLRGTKRWSLALSGLPDPVTNLHVSSANTGSVEFDRRVHRACAHSAGYLQPPAEGAASGNSASSSSSASADALPPSAGRVVSFTLRPGSILYAPAGVWHKVEAEGEDGSLHINFSLSGGGRWSDFVLKRLAPLLWADPAWRQRVSTGDVADAYADVGAPAAASSASVELRPAHPARAHAARLLSSLRSYVASLTPEDLLPDALLAGRLPDEGGSGSSAAAAASTEASAAVDGSSGGDDDDDTGPAVEYAPLLLRAPPADPTERLPPLTKAQRRAEAAAADAGAGAPYAAALQAWAAGGGTAPDVALVRGPLTQIELPPRLQDQLLPSASLPLPEHTGELTTLAVIGGILGRSGTVGRGLDGASGGAQPDYRVKLTVDGALLPAVLAVARLGPGQPTSAGALCAALRGPGGAGDAVHAAAVSSLARLLCYTGALRLAA